LQVSRFSIALYVLGNIPITKEMLRIKHSFDIAYSDILKSLLQSSNTQCYWSNMCTHIWLCGIYN